MTPSDQKFNAAVIKCNINGNMLSHYQHNRLWPDLTRKRHLNSVNVLLGI